MDGFGRHHRRMARDVAVAAQTASETVMEGGRDGLVS
jgi:hypothetical protein